MRTRTIKLLDANDDCSLFSCGEDWLDKYIRKHALRNQDRGYGRTYLAINENGTIDGYYTVSMSSVQFQNLPPLLQYQNMPQYPMPTAHLGCLAVAKDSQGAGFGTILLIDAMRRTLSASEIVAARAVDVKAINARVRDWYASLGFSPFKDLGGPPFHLYMPMETVRQWVSGVAC